MVYTDSATHPPKLRALLFNATDREADPVGEWTADVSEHWCSFSGTQP